MWTHPSQSAHAWYSRSRFCILQCLLVQRFCRVAALDPGSDVVEAVAVLDSPSARPNTDSKYLLGSAIRPRTVLAATTGVFSNVRNSLKAKHRRINGRWFGLMRIFESKVRRREDLCRVAEIGDDRVFRAAHHKVAHSAPASYEGQRQDDCGEARDRPSFGRRRCYREIAHRHCPFQQTTTAVRSAPQPRYQGRLDLRNDASLPH